MSSEVVMAIITTRGPEPRLVRKATATEMGTLTDPSRPWQVLDDIGGWVSDDVVKEVDHLAIIDPDRGPDARRLMHLMGTRFTGSMSDLRDILRQYAGPEEEPEGLGAVAEDAAGVDWVRFDSRTGSWWRDRAGRNVRWSELGPVIVRSKGLLP